MSARTRHRWLAWLLPLIALRAFVPAGFMLSWSDGGWQFMLCSGTGPAVMQQMAPDHGGPDAADAQHAYHAQHAPSSQHEHSSAAKRFESSLCSFAVAGSITSVGYVAAPLAHALVALDAFDFIANPELRSPPVLIDRIRGPPLA